jgi:hypothetical protein
LRVAALAAGKRVTNRWEKAHKPPGKDPQTGVILSEAKNPSLFLFCLYLDRREILRFAQNDKPSLFFRGVFRRCGKSPAEKSLLSVIPKQSEGSALLHDEGKSRFLGQTRPWE